LLVWSKLSCCKTQPLRHAHHSIPVTFPLCVMVLTGNLINLWVMAKMCMKVAFKGTVPRKFSKGPGRLRVWQNLSPSQWSSVCPMLSLDTQVRGCCFPAGWLTSNRCICCCHVTFPLHWFKVSKSSCSWKVFLFWWYWGLTSGPPTW
jgi:hypothetical protein